MGKAVKKIAKPIAKIIPKEIRPALPFILPFIPGIGPALGSMQSALTSKLAFAGKLAPYLSQGIMAAGTQAVTDPNAKTSDLFRTAALSVAPAAISEGLGALPTDKGIGQFLSQTAEGEKVSRLGKIQAALGKVDPGKTGYASQLDVATGSVPVSEVAKIVGPEGFTKAATLAAAQTGLSQAPIVARMNEQALRDYEAQLREQGIMDSAERRNKIFGYFSNAGYDTNEVNAFLDKYGYKYGGRVGYKKAGLVTLDDLINKTPSGELFMSQFKIENKDEDEDEDEYKPRPKFSTKDLMSGLDYASKGLETAFGRPIDMKPQPTRFGLAEGGITSTEEAKVYMTDDNSGVIYRDPEGKPITKEEFFKGTDEAEREGKAMGGIMKKAGKELMKRIVQPAKRKIGQMTDDVEIDVNYDADIYDDGTAYGITEINILPKTKKGKEALDQAVKEGSAEMSSDGSYFVKQPEEVSGLLYEKGIKVSGVNKPQMNRFERFDEGAKYDDSGYNIPDYEIEMFEDLARKRKADGGIMNVSDPNNDRFLEQRAEQYMEEGFSPEDAMDKALDDLKNNRFPALKDGGMLNLRKGGMPAEMDMRGGGFIPIGAKERADDVPARLSKNEFVMTADAVRAAGGGSINKGAKRMYDLMNKLETKV